MKTTLLALTLVVAGIVPAFAQTSSIVAAWNFNNNTTGNPSSNAGTFNTTGTAELYNADTKMLSIASVGSNAATATINLSNLAGSMGGAANNNWGTFAGDTTNAITGTAAGGALAIIGTSNNSKTVDFSFSTLGFTNIAFSYATRGTATGFSDQTWSVSTDGTNFTSLGDISGRNVTTWSTQGFTLADDVNLENVVLRLTVSGDTTTGGNNRIDNFTVTGVAIPEPSTYAMIAGAAGLGFAILRRRRSAAQL